MELSTNYMGLELRNPLVASASPLSHTVDGVRRLADAGVGAVVLHSLFEEQLREEAELDARMADAGSESFAESLSYFPEVAEEDYGPRRHLSLVERAAAAVDVPVIASLNGVTPDGWTELRARDAGRRRRRDRAEHLLRARRPDHSRPRGRAALRRRPRARQGRGHRAGRGQARPVLQLDRRDGAAAGRGGRRRARALQPLPAARYRHGDARGRARPRAFAPGRRAARRGRGSHCCAAGCAVRSRPRRASKTPPTSPSTCSRGRMW